MKKGIVVLFLALIAVYVYGEVTIDGIRYDLDTVNMTATVKGSSLDTVVIPSSVAYETQNYAVTSIGANAFWGNSDIKAVTIPGSVRKIGNGAFQYCGSLASVTIANGVDSIGNNAFENCSITAITIPGSVVSIGSEAFRNTPLTTVTIPGSVRKIGDAAFQYCGSLVSVTLGDGIDSIGDGAFRDCHSITSIAIPGSVTNIGNQAFYGCEQLATATISGNSLNIGEEAFRFDGNLTSLTLTEGVSNIRDYAFEYCVGLTSVAIPGSVDSIGRNAFESCEALSSVTLEDGILHIGHSAFNSCPLTSITIPGSVEKIDDHAFAYCRRLMSATISEGVDSIATEAFFNCPLASVTFNAKECRGGEFTMRDSATINFGDSVMNLENVRFKVDSTTSIYSWAEMPPEFSSSTFTNYHPTLHVPFANIKLYKAAPWRHFNFGEESQSLDITVSSNDSTKGVVSGGGRYWNTERATINALAKSGYAFDRWNDGDISNPRIVTVSQDSSFTAIFAGRTADTVMVRDTIMVSDTLVIYQTDTVYLYQTDTIYLEYDSTAANQYALEDYGVYYFMGTVVNRDNIYIKLYSADGKLLKKGDDDLEMGSYPDGIYIVTDGKGGFLKVIHTRL